MIKSVLFWLMLALLVSGIAGAGDFVVEKVIEVGPCDGIPISWPLKWSPDGTKLAYFYQKALMVSDTLGNVREILKFDLFPFRFEWLSESEVVIHLTNYGSTDKVHQLINLDILSRNYEVLEEFKTGLDRRMANDPKSFNGPYLTIGKKPYIRTNVARADVLDEQIKSERRPLKVIRSRYKNPDDTLLAPDDYILSWGTDGLYKINLNLTDSNNIAPLPYPNMHFPPVLDKDKSYYIQGGTMYRFSDSTYLVIDTVFKEFPPGTGTVDILFVSTNPIYPEVLFTIDFYDGDEYEVFRIGTFDYDQGVLTIWDDKIGKMGCDTPSYSPDGYKIAFIYKGNVFILFRDVIIK